MSVTNFRFDSQSHNPSNGADKPAMTGYNPIRHGGDANAADLRRRECRSAHLIWRKVAYGEKSPQVHCYDKRRGVMEVEVVIDLLLRLPTGYGEEPLDFPTPEFLVEALQSVLRNEELLWSAWSKISNEF